jgi:hypothetical protein
MRLSVSALPKQHMHTLCKLRFIEVTFVKLFSDQFSHSIDVSRSIIPCRDNCDWYFAVPSIGTPRIYIYADRCTDIGICRWRGTEEEGI